MSDDYGPTDDGFNKKTLEEIKESIKERIRASEAFGPDTPIEDTELENIINVFASQASEAWDALE
ncbi:MAG: hypothetical protein ACOCV2_15610, partial [Persicimonas sp.]